MVDFIKASVFDPLRHSKYLDLHHVLEDTERPEHGPQSDDYYSSDAGQYDLSAALKQTPLEVEQTGGYHSPRTTHAVDGKRLQGVVYFIVAYCLYAS